MRRAREKGATTRAEGKSKSSLIFPFSQGGLWIGRRDATAQLATSVRDLALPLSAERDDEAAVRGSAWEIAIGPNLAGAGLRSLLQPACAAAGAAGDGGSSQVNRCGSRRSPTEEATGGGGKVVARDAFGSISLVTDDMIEPDRPPSLSHPRQSFSNAGRSSSRAAARRLSKSNFPAMPEEPLSEPESGMDVFAFDSTSGGSRLRSGKTAAGSRETDRMPGARRPSTTGTLGQRLAISCLHAFQPGEGSELCMADAAACRSARRSREDQVLYEQQAAFELEPVEKSDSGLALGAEVGRRSLVAPLPTPTCAPRARGSSLSSGSTAASFCCTAGQADMIAYADAVAALDTGCLTGGGPQPGDLADPALAIQLLDQIEQELISDASSTCSTDVAVATPAADGQGRGSLEAAAGGSEPVRERGGTHVKAHDPQGMGDPSLFSSVYLSMRLIRNVFPGSLITLLPRPQLAKLEAALALLAGPRRIRGLPRRPHQQHNPESNLPSGAGPGGEDDGTRPSDERCPASADESGSCFEPAVASGGSTAEEEDVAGRYEGARLALEAQTAALTAADAVLHRFVMPAARLVMPPRDEALAAPPPSGEAAAWRPHVFDSCADIRASLL